MRADFDNHKSAICSITTDNKYDSLVIYADGIDEISQFSSHYRGVMEKINRAYIYHHWSRLYEKALSE